PAETLKREGGAKVVKAFWRGFQALDVQDFSFVVKLDADLTLPPEYFEKVSECFALNESVGMCGGILVIRAGGLLKKERSAAYHLRGAIKAYRKECFDQIGGIRPVLNWDFIDEMTAMHLGWKVRILPVEVEHHRVSSTLMNKGLVFSFVMGQTYYKNGYDL